MTEHEEVLILRSKVSMLASAIIANHEWHLNYDEYDGYMNSELFDQNIEAMQYAALATESFNKALDSLAAVAKPSWWDRIVDRFFAVLGCR